MDSRRDTAGSIIRGQMCEWALRWIWAAQPASEPLCMRRAVLGSLCMCWSTMPELTTSPGGEPMMVFALLHR